MTEPQEEQQPMFWTDQDGEGEPTIWTGDRDHPKAVLRRCEIAADEQTRDELMRRVVAVEHPNVPAVSGAREGLVERLAEALHRSRCAVDGCDQGPDETDVRAARDWLAPLVAAQVEAAVSATRAEVERQAVLLRAINDCRDDPARAILQADQLAGAAIIRAEAAESERDALRAEIEHWKHHAWEAGEGFKRAIEDSNRANARARTLREKVAKVEALAEEWWNDAEYDERASAEVSRVIHSMVEALMAVVCDDVCPHGRYHSGVVDHGCPRCRDLNLAIAQATPDRKGGEQ